MILCINTAVPEHHVAIAARDHVETIHELSLRSGHESETILWTIDRLLKKIKKMPRDLIGIAVITGPGGFTSLRIGITIANAFASQLKIPILGITSDEWNKKKWSDVKTRFIAFHPKTRLLEPNYGRPPIITPPKSGSMRPAHNGGFSL